MAKKKEEKENKKSEDRGEKKHKVLQVFGIPLQVSNPRLAELLTMEAKEALTEDVKILRQKLAPKEKVTPEEKKVSYPDFRSRIDEVGEKLGFGVQLGGVWNSPTGVIILVRVVDKPPNLVQAKRYSGALSDQQAKLKRDSAGLFVVPDQISCDIFKAAVRGKNLWNTIRVVSFDNLEKILSLRERQYLDHKQVVTLLVPLDNIDVGELLNVIKAATSIF